MSTPEQPANPPLTRKQIREIRNTGSTPVITTDEIDQAPSNAPEAPAEVDDEQVASEVAAPEPAPTPEPDPAPASTAMPVWSPAPLPRAAEPAVVSPTPVADSSVDLGASPLTRRQARQQERIRTASVPVITPEVAAAHAATTGGAPVAATPSLTHAESPSLTSGMHDLFGLHTAPAPVIRGDAAAPVAVAVATDAEPDSAVSPWAQPASAQGPDEDIADEQDRVVSPLLGAGLLEGEPVLADLPPSFDQLLSRATGSMSMPNALILSQAPEVAPLGAAVTATGEVMITGTLNLPEGLGSTGHARGTADGKEIDATLVDGELPAHSSPTPIAASAAVSTVKTTGEVIRPPAPEKGSRLMMTLAITAGALALALVGVLILAFATGVFA